MTDTITKIPNRPPRYDVRRADAISVSIQNPDESGKPLSAAIVNISGRGARLKVSRSFAVNDSLPLTIRVKDPRYSFEVTAKVCWVAPVIGQDWWLGCSLTPAIPTSALNDLARNGLIERRSHARRPVSLTAIAKWELTSKTSFARILDCSQGGFCLLSQVEAKRGERVQLQFEGTDQPLAVHGKIVWQAQSSEGHVLGCEFLDPGDFATVSRLEASRRAFRTKSELAWTWFKPQDKGGSDRNKHANRSRPILRQLVAAVAAAVVLCCLMLCIQGSARPWNRSAKISPITSPMSTAVWSSTARIDTQVLPRQETVQRPRPATVHRPLLEGLALNDLVTVSASLVPRPMVLNKPFGQVSSGSSSGPSASGLHAGMEPSSVLTNSPAQRRLARDPAVVTPLDVESIRHALASIDRTPTRQRPGLANRAAFPSDWEEVSQSLAATALREGRNFFQLGNYDQAMQSLQIATRLEPDNAEHHFVLAIIQYQQGLGDEAIRSVETAVALERHQPVEDWGRSMQRFQGTARVWLEDARRRLRRPQ
jgi:Tfp pilus assembly protein PilZ